MRLHQEAARMGAEPGRNILVWGVDKRNGNVRAAKPSELRRSIPILERMTAPAQPAGYAAAQGNATLEAFAACESGGDPTAIGGGGLYRGKY
jgi:hypothetical protein